MRRDAGIGSGGDLAARNCPPRPVGPRSVDCTESCCAQDFRRGTAYPHCEDSVVPLLQCAAGLVNTFVLLQQFEWALEGRAF